MYLIYKVSTQRRIMAAAGDGVRCPCHQSYTSTLGTYLILPPPNHHEYELTVLQNNSNLTF